MIAVVVGGAVLVVLSILAIDRSLTTYVEHHARGRLEALARASLGLAEMRLEQITTTLLDLAATGIDDCNPQVIEAMRRAVFSTTILKGLEILDDQGRIVCTHAGVPLEVPAVSREYQVAGQRFGLAVVRFRNRIDRAVRLRLDRPGGRSLSSIVAADALLPDTVFDDGRGSRRLRLTLGSGDVISTRPAGDEGAGLDDGRSLTVRKSSDRYPIAIVAERSRETLADEYQDLLMIGRLGSTVFFAFGLGFLWLSVRRNHNDPVATLKRAIQNGEIVPFFQPTVDTKNGRVRGAEVLARWRSPDGSMISPANFIPLAEQSGLIYELTRALMKRARDEMGAAYASRPRLRLSFNLFAGHLADARIVEDMKKMFEGSAVAFDQLVLEVTERAPLPDLGEARRVIAMLQELGIKVAIDDVGTGHGGLSYLLKLGVDIIKIDKMFVDAISTERYSQTIIETLVELARSMGMEVIAEGVETFEQVEYLRLKGIHEAQGFVFAPPLPASSYLALVEAMERPHLKVVPEPLAAVDSAA
ncbi:MAG: EAL domain-containing protein [Xanthobacteraceae bacterium]|nr:EAL domain-containing protein [Xanthobacteraceae bacterium]